ncbi:hypothetical protein G9A89_005146 [Geosiphon pyriformis]|nr:hypothetical protein G9A89_005146 [Geosiphon pyriformis]
MAELQIVVLALECVPFSCNIKIKDHFGVASNVKADTLASEAADSLVSLPVGVQEHFLMTEGMAVSGNTYHFIQNLFREILFETFVFWTSLVGVYCSSSFAVSCVLDLCQLNVGLYSVICKGFVLKDWCKEAVGVFDEKKRAVSFVIDLVRWLVKLHHSKA